MDHGKCERCRWWDNSTQLASAQTDTTGLCRVSPPTLNKQTGQAWWPFTEDADWCSAFTFSTDNALGD